jgi:hypothetical protein
MIFSEKLLSLGSGMEPCVFFSLLIFCGSRDIGNFVPLFFFFDSCLPHLATANRKLHMQLDVDGYGFVFPPKFPIYTKVSFLSSSLSDFFFLQCH